MYFDWITWSIWLVGFVILVVWIYVPVQEFKTLLKKHRESRQAHFRGSETPEKNPQTGGLTFRAKNK